MRELKKRLRNLYKKEKWQTSYTKGKVNNKKGQKLLQISDGYLRVEKVLKLLSKYLKHKIYKSNNFRALYLAILMKKY